MTKDQISKGILEFCRVRSDEHRDLELKQLSEALRGCDEWNRFIGELLRGLKGKRPEEMAGALILTCFAVGLEVGKQVVMSSTESE